MSQDVRLTGINQVEPYLLATSDEMYDLPAPTFLIEDFLPEGSVSGVTAYPGVGKTWFAFDMADGVGTGGKFLRYFKCREGAVLFVGSDASVFDYARQWRRLTREKFLALQPDADSPPEYENPLRANVRFLIQSDFLFESLDSVRKLIRTSRMFEWGPVRPEFDEATGTTDMVRSTGFSLIIFDTLSKLTRCNQNDNSQMEEVFRNIRLLSEQTGAAVLLLHHNAKSSEFKDGEDWRGAMAQIGALDNWFQLTPSSTDKSVVQVKVKKFRGITPASFFYKMDVNSGDMSEEAPASLAVVEEPQDTKFDDGIAESALALLGKHAGTWHTLKQVCDALFAEHSDLFGDDRTKFETAVRNRLKRLVRKGSVMMQGGGKGRKSSFTVNLVATSRYVAGPDVVAQALSEDETLKGE